jgi:hypothetical protein
LSGKRRLVCDEIVASVEMQIGHRGLAEAGLLGRLGALLNWINERGPYSHEQDDAMRCQVEAILSNRLRIAADRGRVAAITTEVIRKPIFVVGFPRTGTTLLHSLLAEDPAALAPTWLHSHEPSPPPGEGPIAAERAGRASREMGRFLDYVPGLLPLHPYWDKGIHALVEDEELFTLDFRNAYPSLLYRVPSLSVMVEIDQDSRGAYRFHRELLQHLQWQTGRRHWVLKGVGHQFLLDSLFETYPDALCIWPHRDPTAIQASTLAICAVLYDAISPGQIDWRQYARQWVERIKAGLDHVLRSPLLNDDRVLHLDFRSVTEDPIGAVRKIYQKRAIELTSEAEGRMRAWLADPSNRTDRYGRYPYSYEPFGLSEDWVRELFSDYSRRFGLQ